MADQSYKKFVRLLAGMAVLIIGVAMILAFWQDIVMLFRGFLGIAMAIAGLLILYSVKD